MQKSVELKVKEKVDILRGHHIPLTTTRLVLLRFIASKVGHFSAEDIYDALKEEYPSLSIATVYNNMSLFARLGIVQELRIKRDKVVYDTRPDPHDHFLCLICGNIYDIETPQRELPQEIEGHKVYSAQTYYYGVCKNCRKS